MFEDRIYDIVVVGSGPAGLSAAINAIIRNREVLVIGSETCSPSMRKAPLISNYLGITPCSGPEMCEMFSAHALSMGVQIHKHRVDNVVPGDENFMILAGEDMITSRAVVIASGIPYVPSIKGEVEYLGRGLSYCATCDGPLYRDLPVAVIARSASAEEEANYLAEVCSQVYFIPMYKEVGELDPKVLVMREKPVAVRGKELVDTLQLTDQTLQVPGVFMLGGEVAPDQLVPGVELEGTHFKVNRDLETSIPGLFAAGDCTGLPHQIAKAVGEGQVAGLNAARYAASLKRAQA
jgi:thioredoxin reductase (NADPH)